MTSTSNHPAGPETGIDRPWILVVAAAGWAAVTAVAVLLATGVWSVGHHPVTEPAGSPGPQVQVGGRTAPADRLPVPRQRTPGPPTPSPPTPRPPSPRADVEGLAHTGAVPALIPRQRPAHER